MKQYKRAALIVGLIAAGAIFLAGRTGAEPSEAPLSTPTVWETKVDERSGVTVSVKPVEVGKNFSEWKFNIVMDTHSVELDYDLMERAVLVAGEGKSYKPISVHGESGGHHRDNDIIFRAIRPMPEELELRIEGVGAPELRSFRWRLN